MKIRIDSFAGIAPKISPASLPPAAGQEARDVKLISGSLKAINTPKLEATKIVAGATSVSMLGAPGAAIPLSWVADVDVAASPVADTEYRVYYSGDGVPKKTSLALANTGPGPFPAAWYHLGVPTPTAAPALGATTGSVPAGTYSYVYTYVTQFGAVLLEESAPSPPTLITLGATGGVALTGLANPPSLTNYNYAYKRIYRTTGTLYQLVAQISSTATSYTDTLTGTQILGDPLSTDGWLPPPSDLKGITALPSSVLVGFRNNEVWFSEPGFPHAWPVKYMQAFDAQIVGQETFGNTVVLGTQGFPYIGGGMHPDSFTFQKLPMLEPCISKRSMASDEFGVIYASANGLVTVGSDVTGLVSADFVSRESFAQYAPDTFTACVFERRYYGFFDSPTYGAGAMVFARGAAAPLSTLSAVAAAVTIDPKTARMLFVSKADSKLYRFDPPDTVPHTYSWKSKLFHAPKPVSLSCFRITGQEASSEELAYAADLAAQNAAAAAANVIAYAAGNLMSALNESELNAMALNDSTLQLVNPPVLQTVGVTVWEGRNQVLNGEYTLNQIHRLPAGLLTQGQEIGVAGQREVLVVEMASSVQELVSG